MRPKANDKRVRIHFLIQEEVKELLQQVADMKGLGLSPLVNEALKSFLVKELELLKTQESRLNELKVLIELKDKNE